MTSKKNREFLAIIGWPAKYSRSPLIHKHWLQRAGLDAEYEYKAYEIAPEQDFADALRAMAAKGFIGANVTAPYKETAFAAMRHCDAAARQLRAVNTIIFKGDQAEGYNTDGAGFVAGLDAHDTKWRDVPVLVLGAGGAARAIIAALVAAKVTDIRLVNRNRAKAESVAQIGRSIDAKMRTKITLFDWAQIKPAMQDVGLLVNATHLGMTDKPTLPTLPLQFLRPDALVNDLVYSPRRTPLLAQAERAGLRSVDGLGMLLHQAAGSFNLWFGGTRQVDAALRDMLIADLGE